MIRTGAAWLLSVVFCILASPVLFSNRGFGGELALAGDRQRASNRGAESHDRTKKSSNTGHGVTGSSAHVNSAIAQEATATISLQPVAPKTVPPSSYPGGSSITGSTLTLGAVPARVWFEIHITGWAPQELRTIQTKIDANGYMGANADCGGAPAVGAGNLAPASIPCANNAACRATTSGLAAPCVLGEPSTCNFNGSFCFVGFQDKCNPGWVTTVNGAQPIAAVNTSTLSYTYGATSDPGDPILDLAPSYVGTLVLDVPASAKGTYTIGFVLNETFLQDQTQPVPESIPLAALIPGQIEVPCGSCCTDVSSGNSVCTGGVSQAECDGLQPVGPRIFRSGVSCADPPCPNCTSNNDCNANGIPDDCDADCNANTVPDECEIASGTSLDCQPNEVPDECDILLGTSDDLDENGIPDECCQVISTPVRDPNDFDKARFITLPPPEPGAQPGLFVLASVLRPPVELSYCCDDS